VVVAVSSKEDPCSSHTDQGILGAQVEMSVTTVPERHDQFTGGTERVVLHVHRMTHCIEQPH